KELQVLISEFHQNDELYPEYKRSEDWDMFFFIWKGSQPQEGVDAEEAAHTLTRLFYEMLHSISNREKETREDNFIRKMNWNRSVKYIKNDLKPEIETNVKKLDAKVHKGRPAADKIVKFLEKTPAERELFEGGTK